MEKIKIIVGLAIIIASFVYITRNKSSMLDNLLEKSMEKTKEEYEKKQAIQEKAYDVVSGKADAFDTLAEGVKNVVKPIEETVKKDVSGRSESLNTSETSDSKE